MYGGLNLHVVMELLYTLIVVYIAASVVSLYKESCNNILIYEP